MDNFVIAERTRMKVTIFGQDFEVLKPTVAESRSQLSKMKDVSDPLEITAGWQEFLIGRGFPQEVIDSLESDQMWNLVGFVSGNKKN